VSKTYPYKPLRKRYSPKPSALPSWLSLRDKDISEKKGGTLRSFFKDKAKTEEEYILMSMAELGKELSMLLGFKFDTRHLAEISMRRFLYYMTGVRRVRQDIFDVFLDGRLDRDVPKRQAKYLANRLIDKEKVRENLRGKSK